MTAGELIGVAAGAAEAALFAASAFYIALAIRFALRFQPAAGAPPPSAPGLTVVKPLCGAEPGLEDMLASLMSQSYPGRLQVIFCARGADSGLEVAQRVA